MNTILAMGFGGPYDIAIIAGVVILLFGGAKIAGFGKSVGQGIRDFKQATSEDANPSDRSLAKGSVVEDHSASAREQDLIASDKNINTQDINS